MTETSRRRLASLPLALMLLFAAAGSLAQEVRYNVYTVDRFMPSFGDIVSNYVAARHLARTTGAEVNLYIAPLHARKFESVLPEFADRSVGPMRVDVGQGRGLNIYWNAPALAFGDRTCNLAFTIDTLESVWMPELEQQPNGEGLTPPQLRQNWIFNSLEATALRGQPRDRITPFLIFSILGRTNVPRVDLETSRRLMMQSAPQRARGEIAHWPAVFFRSGLNNKLLFLSETPPPTQTLAGNGIHHLGLAYTGEADLITEYINDVMALAVSKPKRRFAVVVPRNYELTHVTVAPPEVPWYVDGLDANNSRRYQLAKDFAVFIVPDGLPYELTERYMAAAGLPVLVTGTMSLSSAIQHGKPFIYEVVRWHRLFGLALGNFFAGPEAPSNVLTSRSNLQATGNPLVLESLLGEETGEHAATRAEARRARQRFLFGINAEGVADWAVFEQNYLQFRARLAEYRGSTTPAEPRRHLLDDLPRMCGEARAALRDINDDFSSVQQRLGQLRQTLSE
jgi:hypothetical protein